MGKRRRARELALQSLFYVDSTSAPPLKALDLFCQNFPPPKDLAQFFYELAKGVIEKRDEIDRLIEQHSNNWKLYRMSAVDLNLMRIAAYEFLFCPDVPRRVSINEAIDIGKRFGTAESGAFINGILDSIHLHLGKEEKAEKKR
ncbi:transcription antitermination factor NusB [Desulfatibacillum aliphaticivorans]|uniref:transcription antitermination factor NusB n=1 Tax=Desulfatibacillum aliphaticivorans TaxID=218208 RepID=UPI00042680B8|nr:transcription antitermination factor NusB [Desulfatibacillum aliphaticivorans]